jgi:hypothetical protein
VQGRERQRNEARFDQSNFSRLKPGKKKGKNNAETRRTQRKKCTGLKTGHYKSKQWQRKVLAQRANQRWPPNGDRHRPIKDGGIKPPLQKQESTTRKKRNWTGSGTGL